MKIAITGMGAGFLKQSFFFSTTHPGENSWDTNAIACQIEASSLPIFPHCSVDAMHSSLIQHNQHYCFGERGQQTNPP